MLAAVYCTDTCLLSSPVACLYFFCLFCFYSWSRAQILRLLDAKNLLERDLAYCLEHGDFSLVARPFLRGADCMCEIEREKRGTRPSLEQWRRTWDGLATVNDAKQVCPVCCQTDPSGKHSPEEMYVCLFVCRSLKCVLVWYVNSTERTNYW